MRHEGDKRGTISMTGSRPSENSLKRRAVSASLNAALENRDTKAWLAYEQELNNQT